jgi:hypothetical protein
MGASLARRATGWRHKRPEGSPPAGRAYGGDRPLRDDRLRSLPASPLPLALVRREVLHGQRVLDEGNANERPVARIVDFLLGLNGKSVKCVDQCAASGAALSRA